MYRGFARQRICALLVCRTAARQPERPTGVDAFERKRRLGTGAPLFSGVDDAGGMRLLVYGSGRK